MGGARTPPYSEFNGVIRRGETASLGERVDRGRFLVKFGEMASSGVKKEMGMNQKRFWRGFDEFLARFW